jgi:hypothetical protein
MCTRKRGAVPPLGYVAGLDFQGKQWSFQHVSHPMEEGFEQHYAVG